jgi:hypothetical protein
MTMGRPRSTHKVLAAIRIVNGAAGLLFPAFLLRRLGTDPRIDRSGVYPFRMFGIRTVLIGLDLLTLRDEDLRRASSRAVLIHACDTVSAASAALLGDLPRRAGMTATLISATNTVLAVLAARKVLSP